MKKKNIKSFNIAWLWVIAFSPIALLALMLILTGSGAFGRLPSFVELENPKSNLATEIYSEDGAVIGSFYIQNRSFVQYEELFPTDTTINITLDGYHTPPLVAALISTEDERYRSHGGVDIPSLFRVGIKTLALGQAQGGGSTITQQLAKNLFPRDTVRNRSKVAKMGKLIGSKFKEWITAVKLEYNYTKEEIATMYLNVVEFGSSAFGIKSASQVFFNKLPSQLNIQEAALLVGVVNAPTHYSPVRNYDNAIKRRNVVLQRMAKSGAITKHTADSLSALPIRLDYSPVSHNLGEATYFREMLRLVMNAKEPKRNNYYNEWDYDQALKTYNENPIYGWCHKNKRADGSEYDIYRDGLKIYTTINSKMQRMAENAVQKQMEEVIQPMMDQQARAYKSIFVDAPANTQKSIIDNAIRYSDRYSNMSRAGYSREKILASFDKEVPMRIFTFKGERDTVLTPRDSIMHHKRIMRASMVAMDPKSGAVKAYVGGPNFKYFKYDMAKQGKRQIGSTIKPFIYTFAIDHLGLTPCTRVPNLPVTIEGANGTAWSPKEAGNVKYDGFPNPLYWGMALSRNNYSAWIMKQAKQPAAVADFIHNMGIKSFIDPVPALCLGVSESNPFEMAAAYSTFANQGVYTEPIFVTRIEDRQGNIISTFIPKSQDAINEQTAYTMLEMLRKVVTNGTAIRMVYSYDMAGVEMGGKTGTSQKNRDAWFMGVTPNLVVSTWVGGEDQYIHPRSRGEGSVMALPIAGEFLREVHKDKSLGVLKTDTFTIPAQHEFFNCDKDDESKGQLDEYEQNQSEGEDDFFE